jgi:hypothetical protein
MYSFLEKQTLSQFHLNLAHSIICRHWNIYTAFIIIFEPIDLCLFFVLQNPQNLMGYTKQNIGNPNYHLYLPKNYAVHIHWLGQYTMNMFYRKHKGCPMGGQGDHIPNIYSTPNQNTEHMEN